MIYFYLALVLFMASAYSYVLHVRNVKVGEQIANPILNEVVKLVSNLATIGLLGGVVYGFFIFTWWVPVVGLVLAILLGGLLGILIKNVVIAVFLNFILAVIFSLIMVLNL